MPYRIEYDPKTWDHFSALTARERAAVLDVVDRQLLHEPTLPTRNRKLLRANPVAPWELRVGEVRVYYEVSEGIVTIRAIGVKRRDRVFIGKEEIEL